MDALTGFAVAALGLAALPAPGASTPAEPAPPAEAAAALALQPAPPPFRPDRTAEDYSFLRDPARRGDWSDPYKFVPLDEAGRFHLSFGGEIRERFEAYDAPRFGLAGASRDEYLLQRVLAHADLRAGNAVRLFVQLGAHEAFGKTSLNPPDEDHVDFHQLFAEIRPAKGVSVRLGRQEMILNPMQRFVTFRDGTNVRQNFEGGRASYEQDGLRLDAFLVQPVTLRRGSFDNRRDRNQNFAGLYVSHRVGEGLSLDAYWMRLDREALAGQPPGGRERRNSVGLRFAGSRSGFDWDAETLYQFGSSYGRDIGAWALSVDSGYTIAAAPLHPRFGLRFDAGSGDGDPADGDAGGFFPLFPSGPYFNEANLTSWTNLLALRPSLRVAPAPRLTLLAAVQLKWRESAGDAVYLGPSAPLAGTQANREREIGQVYTLDANFQLNRNLGLRAYYLHHSAGDAIAAAGGRAVDFAMASVTLRF